MRTPLGEWQTVARVEQENQYAPCVVYMRERPEFGWRYTRWTKVDAVPPAIAQHGKPEVRAIVGSSDIRMYALAILDSDGYGWTPSNEQVLVEAGNAGRGKGWWVVSQPAGLISAVDRVEGLSKAGARSEVKRRGREFAKRLKVPFREADGLAR